MRIAKLILHYRRDDLTREVLRTFPDALVVDNGSESPFPGAALRFEQNLGFTRGFNEAVRRVFDRHDAFLLLNNDIRAEPGVLDKIEAALARRPRLGIVSPHCNGPHPCMWKHPTDFVRYVPYVEFVAVAIRKEVFQSVGWLDERFSLGWGVDYDFCWRARRAGFGVGVHDSAGVQHLEHQTIDSTCSRYEYFGRAGGEMHAGLSAKYGPGWHQLLTTMLAALVLTRRGSAHADLAAQQRTGLFDELVAGIADAPAAGPPSGADGDLYEVSDTVLAAPPPASVEQLSHSAFSAWNLLLLEGERVTPEFSGRLRELICSGKAGYHLSTRATGDVPPAYRLFNADSVSFGELGPMRVEGDDADELAYPALTTGASDPSRGPLP
jgi:GT2 family glycosyltransferase